MDNQFTILLGAIALLFSSVSHSSVIIDFDNLSSGPITGETIEDGFRLSWTDMGIDTRIGGMEAESLYDKDGWLRITHSTGENFRIDSIDLQLDAASPNNSPAELIIKGFDEQTYLGMEYIASFSTGYTTAAIDGDLQGQWLSHLDIYSERGLYALTAFDNVVLTSEVSQQVPEPSVLALFSAGLVGLGFARRRKLRQS